MIVWIQLEFPRAAIPAQRHSRNISVAFCVCWCMKLKSSVRTNVESCIWAGITSGTSADFSHSLEHHRGTTKGNLTPWWGEKNQFVIYRTDYLQSNWVCGRGSWTHTWTVQLLVCGLVLGCNLGSFFPLWLIRWILRVSIPKLCSQYL